MDFHSGWDITNSTSIANEVLEHLHDVNRNRKGVYSALFNRYDHYAVDIMTSLVILPLNIENNESYSSLKKAYKIFLKQFAKIELIVLSSFTQLRILKILVDNARESMSSWYNKRTRREAVEQYESKCKEGIDRLINMAILDDIDFEKVLCSLLMFGRHLETYISHKLRCHLYKKRDCYSRLKVETPIEVYGMLEIKIPMCDNMDNTSLAVWKPLSHVFTRKVSIPSYIKNKHALNVGKPLYSLINQSSTNKEDPIR
jgi:hypothetical protein